jgi:hypothetical protein
MGARRRARCAGKTYLEIGGGHAALLELVDEDEALRELFEGLVFYDLVALLDGLHDGARIFDGGGGHDRWGDETRERRERGEEEGEEDRRRSASTVAPRREVRLAQLWGEYYRTFCWEFS